MGKRIVILCHGQWGDAATCSSVLRYKKELWGDDCEITWFIAKENMDMLKYQDINVKEFPRGFGYPEMVKEENEKLIAEGKEPSWYDWQPLMDENNHLNLELAKNDLLLSEFDFGAFPAPHHMSAKQRHGLLYATCSKKVFGINMDWEWHPVLKFSDDELISANKFVAALPYKKTVCWETMAGSGQSLLEDEEVITAMGICKDVLGECNFVFMSHKYLRTQEEFPAHLLNRNDVFFAKRFTVRQCALIVGLSDLLISVSSGISVASSCWGNNPTPILQICGSEICSTKAMALGRFELVTHDDKILDDAYNEMNLKLTELLKSIK